MAAGGTPQAEFMIDSEFVAKLVAEQHPDLAHLPLQSIDSGWDNAMFRLGDSYAVRLPRRAVAAPLIAHEQAWLPRLAAQLSLPVPVPYRIGTPALGYPWRWSIVPWLPGHAADQHVPHSSQAHIFAAFLRSLHVAAPGDAPRNPLRGGPLHGRGAVIEERMERLAAKSNLITPKLRQIWERAVSAPQDVPATWLHGDLHPRNILVEHGIITGIIDWGDITAGDRATDLASIWMLFAEPAARDAAWTAYANLSEATFQRAQGWAIMFGTVLLDTGLIDNPRHAAIGERTLRRVVESD